MHNEYDRNGTLSNRASHLVIGRKIKKKKLKPFACIMKHPLQFFD